MMENLQPEVLLKHGFKKRKSNDDFDNYDFVKRIHIATYLYYCSKDGFMKIALDHEFKHMGRIPAVIIPKPVRSEEDLVLLLSALCQPSTINTPNYGTK